MTFWNKFVQKGESCISPLHSAYLNHSKYQISASTDNFDFSDQVCPRKVFPVKNGKSEYHHSILHFRISLGTKCQLKLIILIFWTKFAEKGYFPFGMVKLHLCMRPWLLLTVLNFSTQGLTNTSPFSLREKNFLWIFLSDFFGQNVSIPPYCILPTPLQLLNKNWIYFFFLIFWHAEVPISFRMLALALIHLSFLSALRFSNLICQAW